MSKPWAVMIAGVSTLLVVGLVIKHFRGSGAEPQQASKLQEQMAMRAAQERTGERSGWAARPADEDGSASLPGGKTKSGAQASVSGQGGAASGDAGDTGRHGAKVLRGDSRRSGVALGPWSEPAADGSVTVTTGVEPSREPFPGARSAASMRGGLSSRVVSGSPTNQTNESQNQEDENGLVLSLPLDGTAEPDKGDAQPAVVDGVTFDSEGAKFSSDSQFVIPNPGELVGESGTISFWVQPDWQGTENSTASLVDLRAQHVFENRIQIDKNGQFLRFIFADNSGKESGAGYPIGNWQPGEWHQVTTTWGEALATLYVDGRQVGQQTYDGQFQVLPETQFRVGSNYPGDGPGASSTMSHVQVFKKALSPDEAAQLITNR